MEKLLSGKGEVVRSGSMLTFRVGKKWAVADLSYDTFQVVVRNRHDQKKKTPFDPKKVADRLQEMIEYQVAKEATFAPTCSDGSPAQYDDGRDRYVCPSTGEVGPNGPADLSKVGSLPKRLLSDKNALFLLGQLGKGNTRIFVMDERPPGWLLLERMGLAEKDPDRAPKGNHARLTDAGKKVVSELPSQ